MNTHSRQRHCKHDVTVARGSIERCVTCGAVLTNSENFAETVVKVLQSKNKGAEATLAERAKRKTDDIHARELAAMQAHTEAVEKERDKLRVQCDTLELANRFANKSSIDAFAYMSHLKERLATVEARADRAEHFVRIIAGLRPGHIGEAEAGQLVRTAQATLQPITPKGTI